MTKSSKIAQETSDRAKVHEDFFALLPTISKKTTSVPPHPLGWLKPFTEAPAPRPPDGWPSEEPMAACRAPDGLHALCPGGGGPGGAGWGVAGGGGGRDPAGAQCRTRGGGRAALALG